MSLYLIINYHNRKQYYNFVERYFEMKMKKKKPTEEELKKLGIKSWGTWSKEKSVFDWSYDDTETCYILDGEVEVTDSETERK